MVDAKISDPAGFSVELNILFGDVPNNEREKQIDGIDVNYYKTLIYIQGLKYLPMCRMPDHFQTIIEQGKKDPNNKKNMNFDKIDKAYEKLQLHSVICSP